MSTGDLPVSEARSQLARIIDQARDDHAPVYLSRHGRRVAAIIDADDLDALLAIARASKDRAGLGPRAAAPQAESDSI